jgi:hypothetical protein
MRSMPRPQASIWPLRKKVLAMSGLKGADGCLDSNRSTVHSGGRRPEFQIITLSEYTLIWIGAPLV